MRIDELQLRGFGKWREAVFRFAPGINLFCAPNEAGKSTLLQGLFAALYGMKKDYVRTARYLPEYEKYLPWDGGAYETIVQYEVAGKSYRLHRWLEKEREQARLFLNPDWSEVTGLYQEDRRKERNFLELHLGLTRSLFTDVTWIRREPMAAAEHLLPSLGTDEADPAVNRVLAELERELAAIGKKERAENTLLGKAGARVAEKERALAEAEAGWAAASSLARHIADWEAERKERERAREKLRQRLQRMEQEEAEWQARWRHSHVPPSPEQWEEWERNAVTAEERRLHRETRERLAALAARSVPDADTEPGAERERLEAAYQRAVELRKAWEACREQVNRLAASAIAGTERPRQGRKAAGGLSAHRLLWAGSGLLMALAAGAFAAGRGAFGWIASVLAVFLAAAGAWIRRRARGNQRVPAVIEEWRRLQQEADRLEAELCDIYREWNAADWDAFLLLREEQMNRSRQREADRQAAEWKRREEEARLLARWGDALRSLLEAEKAERDRERDGLVQSLRETEERLQELREQIARASGEMGSHDAVSVARARSEYEDAAAALRSLQMRREALRLARDTLQEALAEWNRDVSPVLNGLASDVMARITGGRYRDVRLDPRERFAVRLLEPDRHLVVEQEQCSLGTQDQLHFAQRVALLRLVSRQTEPLPLFLDDHFAHYDQERLERTLTFVAELSEEHQVFLFTCQERELTLLEPYLRGSDRHMVHRL
ncbi:AAA family ATPase [Brevibacillus sp. LEMMJ03]|uniref:ATP-binding protein n=1 Tax=Brevibacillus sp. LEMMJ03 TaxID=2595056 RepID=UPI0011800379|nr:AAA family ATPase [Brevibacillus sp. LEMMJ03]TRY24385.1 AAA family ATPase [Brevibacillus sp. LEMMJ03]